MFRKLLITLLIIHTIVSVYVFKTESALSVFPPFNELYAYQVFSDVVMLGTLTLFFIWYEMKYLKKPMTPFWILAVGTLCLGSFAPLTFLLWRKDLFTR